jgi:RecB family exonuclease
MPLDMRLAARHAGPRILLRFVQDFPDTYIVGLEREYTRGIDTGFGVFDFTGRVDRIDERGLGEIILDYKTGSVPACRKNFWRNEALFERLAGWSPGLDPDLAAEVAEAMPSVQLPLYMLLYREETGREPMDAAWVDLRNGCREKNALPAREAEAEREAMLGGRFQALAGFLLRHMLEEPRFEPRPGRHCDFCPYRGGCPR